MSRRTIVPGVMAVLTDGEVVRICAVDAESIVVETDDGKREITRADIQSTYTVEPCRGADERYLGGLIRGTDMDTLEEDET
jgi:hypothetical protein